MVEKTNLHIPIEVHFIRNQIEIELKKIISIVLPIKSNEKRNNPFSQKEYIYISVM